MSFAFVSPRERRLWIVATLLVATSYSTLYWVRIAALWLRERDLLVPTTSILLTLGAGLTLLAVVRSRPRGLELAVLAAAALGFLALFPELEQPEERLHLLQYGLLGGLLYAALAERRARGGRARAVRLAAVTAFLLTTAIGWGDEGIQALLPNRVYDLRDVAFNAVSGLLVITAMAVRHRIRTRGAPGTGGAVSAPRARRQEPPSR